jgi:AraC-like DNA-binding protein
MYLNPTEFIIFFSGVVYFLSATVYLFEKNKTTAHYTLIGMLFSVGIWQLYHGCMVSGMLMQYPHLALIHVPFLYLTAPFLYFFFKILAGENYNFTAKSALHLLPSLFFTLMLLPFYLQTADEKRELIQNSLGPDSHPLEYPFYPTIIFIIILAISMYAVAFLVKIIPLIRKKELSIKNMTFFSLIFIAINYFLIFLYLFGFTMVKLYNFPHSFYLSIIKTISLLLAVQICLMMIIKTRYPDYFKQIRDEGQRIRYTASRITGLNVEEVLQKLVHLMMVEKVFCDEDLTLGTLANELNISPYQLSQILNERLNKNFNAYINEYRIREAGKILVEEPDRTITSISYAVGFNTLSSFYNSFSKIHNLSPATYRKKQKRTVAMP